MLVSIAAEVQRVDRIGLYLDKSLVGVAALFGIIAGNLHRTLRLEFKRFDCGVANSRQGASPNRAG